MRLKPAMRYQLREYLVAGGFFWGISVVLMLLSIWLPLHFQLDEYQVYSWYGFSCTIFFFVFGIVLPRQATRLCVQMGVSRRTAYLSLYLMAAVASLCMAVAGQVLMLIGNAVAAQTPFGTGLQDFLVGCSKPSTAMVGQ